MKIYVHIPIYFNILQLADYSFCWNWTLCSDGLFHWSNPIISLLDSALWDIAIINNCVTVSARGWWTFRLVLKLSTINISLSLPISLQPLYNKISDTDLTCIGIHLASLNGKFNFLTQSQKEGNIKYTNYCIKYKQKMHMKQTTKAQNQRQYNEVNHEFESNHLLWD